MESYFCGISGLHAVLAEPVHVFKTAEKHVGIKLALLNKITKLQITNNLEYKIISSFL